MVNTIIKTYHDEMAHCALEKTYQGLHETYWFPSARKRIKDYIDNCVVCLMANSSINRFEGESQIEPPPEKPFEIIHADHFGPLQETADGYKYVFAVIDVYSRYACLYPTKTTNAKEVCDRLKSLFNIFRKPVKIVTDRGSAFTSKEFATFLQDSNIKLHKVAVASPWANGIIERVNRFRKSSLTKIIESPADWKRQLNTVQYVINNTVNSSIKASPSKLLLGYDQHNHSDKYLKNYIDCWLGIENNIGEQRDSIRNIAQQANNKLREYNRSYYDKRHKKPTEYKTGDLVLVRDLQAKTGVSQKLKPNYKEPYQGAKVLNKNRCVITDIPGFNITQKPCNTILFSDKLKPWIKPISEPVDTEK
ncbi:unnamed protein product [Lasius platythorax]|uniref:RNA-directed DNA polymerase n=1 Tax=Lasius platythorax TaxID=488582 RepID=A0AAV2NU06_9HYME